VVKVSQLIGGAGTGKTAKLLSLMDHGMKRWGDPFRIGFVTFTRSARREASTRAADRYNLRPDDLETRGLIRTLHSICYQALGVKDELITGSAESRKWLQEALQDAAVAPSGDLEDEYSSLGFYDGEAKSDAAMTLQLWSAARNRIVPFREVWKEAWTCEFRLPDLEKCRQIVEQYEDQKALFSRLDFVDLLAHFAGYKFFFDGPERRPPDGQVPDAPMWLFDEQQDASPLLHAVCQRLIDSAVWAYVAADPGQAIYGWAGADPALFMWGWDYHQTQVMRQSWRCPQEILDLGENLLRGTDGFFDRHVAGRDRKDGEKKNSRQ
jgi:superfamily I DNA/RNA helicase